MGINGALYLKALKEIHDIKCLVCRHRDLTSRIISLKTMFGDKERFMRIEDCEALLKECRKKVIRYKGVQRLREIHICSKECWTIALKWRREHRVWAYNKVQATKRTKKVDFGKRNCLVCNMIELHNMLDYENKRLDRERSEPLNLESQFNFGIGFETEAEPTILFLGNKREITFTPRKEQEDKNLEKFKKIKNNTKLADQLLKVLTDRFNKILQTKPGPYLKRYSCSKKHWKQIWKIREALLVKGDN